MRFIIALFNLLFPLVRGTECHLDGIGAMAPLFTTEAFHARNKKTIYERTGWRQPSVSVLHSDVFAKVVSS